MKEPFLSFYVRACAVAVAFKSDFYHNRITTAYSHIGNTLRPSSKMQPPMSNHNENNLRPSRNVQPPLNLNFDNENAPRPSSMMQPPGNFGNDYNFGPSSVMQPPMNVYNGNNPITNMNVNMEDDAVIVLVDGSTWPAALKVAPTLSNKQTERTGVGAYVWKTN